MASSVGGCVPCSPVPRSVSRALEPGVWGVQSPLPTHAYTVVGCSGFVRYTGSPVPRGFLFRVIRIWFLCLFTVICQNWPGGGVSQRAPKLAAVRLGVRVPSRAHRGPPGGAQRQGECSRNPLPGPQRPQAVFPETHSGEDTLAARGAPCPSPLPRLPSPTLQDRRTLATPPCP